MTCVNYIANYKIFQEHELNSRRCPVFPGAISNSERFPGVPGVVDILDLSTKKQQKKKLNHPRFNWSKVQH